MPIDIRESDTDGTRTTSEPVDTALPEGSESFDFPPPVITIREADNDGERSVGVSASGFVALNNKAQQGVVQLLDGDVVIEEKDLTSELYEIIGDAPAGVASGENQTFSGITVRYIGEDGSRAEEDISGFQQTVNFDLGEVIVIVNDVNGDPSNQKTVTIEGQKYQTNTNGRVELGSSGTVNVSGLDDAVSKSTSVDPGGSTTVQFDYAGIEGQVKTATGGPINGITVRLLDSNSNELDRSETNSSGEYSFDEVPPDRQYTVVAGPFDRSVTSPGEGSSLFKKLPFDTDVSGIEIEANNSSTGDSIVGVDIRIDDFVSTTDSRGIGRSITTDDGEQEIIVAKEDRRYIEQTVSVTLVINDTVETSVDLEEKQNVGTY